jgi:DNA-binding MarR family transcriptional regulator
MGTPRWLTADQERAWRGYRRMRTLLDLRIARDLNQDSGLSDADYDVLSTLSERPHAAWRSSDLAKHLLWSTSRLSHHIGRMETRGMVSRRPSADDGRGAVVTLTDLGWATLREAAPHHVESVRRNLVDLLDAEEIATLDRIAEKVIARLSE